MRTDKTYGLILREISAFHGQTYAKCDKASNTNFCLLKLPTFFHTYGFRIRELLHALRYLWKV